MAIQYFGHRLASIRTGFSFNYIASYFVAIVFVFVVIFVVVVFNGLFIFFVFLVYEQEENFDSLKALNIKKKN